MNIVFFGTPDFVIPVLTSLSKVHTLIGVVSAPDTVQGRKKILTPSPVKHYAVKSEIPLILTPEKLTTEIADTLKTQNPDLFVVAAYGKIIPESVLSIPRYGALNIHPSLLPKYRGPSPIQSALLAGDKETGVSIIKMDEKMDHGPILAQESVILSNTDTFASLHRSLFEKAAEMILSTIQKYMSGDIQPQPQDHDKATFCKLITKEDGYFPLDTPPPPIVLDRMIRAYYPWPTAWTRIRMKNQESRIMKILPENKLQLEGGKVMRIKELLNGYPELKEIMTEILNLKS